MFVKTAMTPNPFTTTPDATIPEALEVMETHQVRHLPVLENGRLVGVVSRGDIRQASPSKATSLDAGELLYLLSKLTIRKVMTAHPLTVAPDALLEQAAILMRDNRIEMLPVVENDTLVGVITESNLLDSLIDVLGFRDPGSRLLVEAVDEPGALAKLGTVTGHYGANISHLAVFRGERTSSVLLGLNTTDTADIEAELAANGFTVQARLENN